ncbi:OmpA family protein [Allorhizobium undicola]|uniref:OmpA family protein n=1 Tax=Allorhizobium undicola TaxID=78527 RepID=UPI003D34142F
MAGQMKISGPILVAVATLATSSMPFFADTSLAASVAEAGQGKRLALDSSTMLTTQDGLDLARVGGVQLAQAEEQLSPEELMKRRQKEGGQKEGGQKPAEKGQGHDVGEGAQPQRRQPEPQAEPQQKRQPQAEPQQRQPQAEPQQQKRQPEPQAEPQQKRQQPQSQPQGEAPQPPAQRQQQKPAQSGATEEAPQQQKRQQMQPPGGTAPQQARPEKPADNRKAAPAASQDEPSQPQKPADPRKKTENQPAANPAQQPAAQQPAGENQPAAKPKVPAENAAPTGQQPQPQQKPQGKPAQPPVNDAERPGAAPDQQQRPPVGQPQAGKPQPDGKPTPTAPGSNRPQAEQPTANPQGQQQESPNGQRPQPDQTGKPVPPGQPVKPLPPGQPQGQNQQNQQRPADPRQQQQQGDLGNGGRPQKPILPPLTATQDPQGQRPGDPRQPGKPADPKRIEEAVTPKFQENQPQLTPQDIQRLKRLADRPQDSDETIILPVDRGAPVLDSDKDNNWRRGLSDDQLRRLRRDNDREYVVPDSDAQAQSQYWGDRRDDWRSERIDRFEGRRLQAPPTYDYPEDVRVERRFDDDRTVMDYGGQIVVRSDDNRRFAEYGRPPVYEDVGNGRVRVTVFKENGDRIVTLRNRYGQLIQRSRVDANGQDYVLFFSPDLYYAKDTQPYVYRDPGAELPPMRLRVPLNQYIVDVASEPQRDYYNFFEQPPVEPVERVYTIDEVRNSARIRDKMRRVDLDTITFPTGSAEVTMNQAGTLKHIADGINKVLQKNPAETFMIEGHTDAVGSAESNLVLSDRRAEAVANILTQVYGIPPENMVTQGYGEQFLKVMTYNAAQENRRVTIRRITPLVRPVETSQQQQ